MRALKILAAAMAAVSIGGCVEGQMVRPTEPAGGASPAESGDTRRTDKLAAFLAALQGRGGKAAPAAGTAAAAAAPEGGAYVDPGESNRLGQTCYQLFESRRYDKLFACVDQLEKMRIPPSSREYHLRPETISRAYRAEALIDLGDYAKAAENARIGYELTAPLPRGPGKSIAEIQNLTALAMAHALAGERAKAEEAFARLEPIFNKFNDPRVRGKGGTTPMAQASTGRVYLAMGQYQKAIAAVEKDKTSLLDKPNVFMRQQFIQAKSLMELGRTDEAKALYEHLIGSESFREVASLYWLALFDAGRIEERAGRLEKAIEHYRRAVEVIEQQRSSINTEASKIGFAGNRQAVYARLVGALFEAGRIDAAFDIAERGKARALVDMLAAKQDFAVAGADAEQVKALLAETRSSEQAALEAGGNTAATRSIVVDLREKLARAAPQLASLVSVKTLSAAEVQATLAPDEALVEYYLEGGELHAFVLSREAVRGFRLQGQGIGIDVRDLRQALTDPQGNAYLVPARKLYDTLLRPLEAALKPRLVFVAHGPLHYLPFGALYDGSRFLVESRAIRLLPSASVVKFIRERGAERPGGILAFGNPDLGDPRYDLQFAQEEAVAIAGAVPRSRALLRQQATESALREYGAGFSYLHFATHGTFNPEAPLRSALLLAREPGGDGRLTADKLYSMRLDADLVTLSACETGLGRTAGGDDVLGLTRGFVYAGARSIVSSLWQVDDLATARLMTRFYGNLLQRQDKRTALQGAQLATMKAFPHPYFWAAFQLTGSAD